MRYTKNIHNNLLGRSNTCKKHLLHMLSKSRVNTKRQTGNGLRVYLRIFQVSKYYLYKLLLLFCFFHSHTSDHRTVDILLFHCQFDWDYLCGRVVLLLLQWWQHKKKGITDSFRQLSNLCWNLRALSDLDWDEDKIKF